MGRPSPSCAARVTRYPRTYRSTISAAQQPTSADRLYLPFVFRMIHSDAAPELDAMLKRCPDFGMIQYAYRLPSLFPQWTNTFRKRLLHKTGIRGAPQKKFYTVPAQAKNGLFLIIISVTYKSPI